MNGTLAARIVLTACSWLLLPSTASAVERLPAQLEGVTVKERLGRSVDLGAAFRDHTGKAVHLRDYLGDGKPVLLTLNYYRCKTLCSLQLNAVMRGLKELGWKPGEAFRIVTVSINPREGPELARGKRARYIEALGMGAVEWHFLVGRKVDIDRVARSVGFTYRYLAEEDQYAHPTAIFVLSPQGRLSRYLYGISYPGRQLKLALIDASAGRVGSTVDRLILSCFHYDAATGRYGPFAFGIMRLAGAATAAMLALLMFVLWRRERSRRDVRPTDVGRNSKGHAR